MSTRPNTVFIEHPDRDTRFHRINDTVVATSSEASR